MASSKQLKNAHGGFAGRSLIQRIEKQMDKRRKIMEDMVVRHGMAECIMSQVYIENRGRMQGLGAALAILRSSSIGHEIERCHERLGIE